MSHCWIMHIAAIPNIQLASMVVWKLPTYYVSDTINSLPSCIHDKTFTNSLNGLSIYCKRSEEPPPHLLGAPLVLNPKWRGGSETSLCLNSLLIVSGHSSTIYHSLGGSTFQEAHDHQQSCCRAPSSCTCQPSSTIYHSLGGSTSQEAHDHQQSCCRAPSSCTCQPSSTIYHSLGGSTSQEAHDHQQSCRLPRTLFLHLPTFFFVPRLSRHLGSPI